MGEPTLRNIRITVAYRGTRYGGWQRQPNATTIQELLEEAIRRITRERVTVIGSGRTDAGVHALGQVANFKTAARLAPAEFVGALNAHLPKDIAVLDAAEVPLEFNSRVDARRKTYRYHIWRSRVRPIAWAEYVYHRKSPLDPAAMAEAARLFEGRHDFGSFATELNSAGNTVREVYVSRVDWSRLPSAPFAAPWQPPGQGVFGFQPEEVAPPSREGELISFTVTGSGFLYNMVRAMAGTLIEVGRGALAAEDVAGIMKARDRAQAGPTAPPEGLVLLGIDHP
jgi:tRNA pseudouridine38-40 synthase